MKKVMLKTTMAGPNGCFLPGQVISVEDDLAANLVVGEYAEYVNSEMQELEIAALEQPQKAILLKPKRR